MAPGNDNDALKTEELTELVRGIRERVRAQYPSGSHAGVPVALADLMPLLHARDAAEAKVAAIGSVNPRKGGPVNAVIQGIKRSISRGLNWFVRDQVVFNQEAMACVEATLEALNEVNRAVSSLANHIGSSHQDLESVRQGLAGLQGLAEELNDIRTHWTGWRVEWERKLSVNEVQFLRSVADLEGAYQHRATLMESNFRDLMKSQHADFTSALERAALDIQKKLWNDLSNIRTEYERVIHSELRLARQRAGLVAASPGVSAGGNPEQFAMAFDYGRLADRFRGPEEYVRSGQQFYVPYFKDCENVLDIGCGRGEFLELMRKAGISARGIDLDRESIALCTSKGLEAEVADLFVYLEQASEGSLDGIFSAQVVEHLEPLRVPEMIRLAGEKLARGGVLVIETPNPECLAIYATHFYLDPTHRHPIPAALLSFYLEEYGLGRIEVHYRAPATDSMSALNDLPDDFRRTFFGGLDYAVVARKLI